MTDSSDDPVRKALFRSPTIVDEDKTAGITEALLNKVMIDHEIDTSLDLLQRDLHEQRMKKLKSKLKDIEEDNWKYPSIEKLIGPDM